MGAEKEEVCVFCRAKLKSDEKKFGICDSCGG